MPEGDGTHSTMVSKELQVGAQATTGDMVHAILQLEDSGRAVTVPEELGEGFGGNTRAASVFTALTPHRK